MYVKIVNEELWTKVNHAKTLLFSYFNLILATYCVIGGWDKGIRSKAFLSWMESRSSFLVRPADCLNFVKFCLRFQTQSELVSCFCCVADWNVDLPFTRLDHRSEELSTSHWYLWSKTLSCLPDLSRTRMTMSSCVSETWVTSAQGRLIGSALRARIIGTLIKTSGIIFTIRFVTQWLLLNILLNFLCSAQQYTSSSLLWTDYCRINVDERVVICLKAYSSFTKVSLLFVLMYVITFIMNFRFV